MCTVRAPQDGLEAALDRLCGSCAGRKGCAVEGPARVYWPEHPQFPSEWAHDGEAWRCAVYQPPRLVGTGRIDDPAQVELFSP